MIKYYKNVEGNIHELKEDANNTIEQLLCYNPDLVEEVTFEEYQLQDVVYAKESKCSEINSRTDTLILAGIVYNNVKFNMTLEDQMNINTLFNLLNNGIDLTGQYFRASGEDYYFESDQDFIGLVANCALKKEDLIKAGAVLKTQVNACLTKDEIDDIKDLR